MTWRDRRYRALQVVLWNPVGIHLLRLARGCIRRFEAVALNCNLNSPTNGEEWLIDRLPRAEPITVIDVGFHHGDFTASVLERRPATARVIGFDPWRPAAAAFDARFKNDDRVRLVAVALAAEPGKAAFHDYGSACNSLAVRADAGPEQDCYEVPVVTLDGWCAENGIDQITLLKIDAEGFDLAVLEGARGLLEAGQIDAVMFEYSTGWIAARRYLKDAADYFAALPYQLHRLGNGFISPFAYREPEEAFALRGGMFVATAVRDGWQANLPRRSYLQ